MKKIVTFGIISITIIAILVIANQTQTQNTDITTFNKPTMKWLCPDVINQHGRSQCSLSIEHTGHRPENF